MLSRLIRYGASTSVSIISNKLFPPPRPSVSYLRSFSSIKTSNIDPEVVRACNHTITATYMFKVGMLSGKGIYSTSDYNYILSSLNSKGDKFTVIKLFQHWEKYKTYTNVFPNVDTWKILIHCHCISGNMPSAFSLFHKIIKTGHRPAPSTLNDLFEGLCLRRQFNKAIMLLNYSILKGFELDHHSYVIIIEALCDIGETKIAINLLRQLPHSEHFSCRIATEYAYSKVISRLCDDKLVNEAYALFSDIVKSKMMIKNCGMHHHLIYGYCITGQFKQAIAILKGSKNISSSIYFPTLELGPEHEVKAAKRAAAVLIKRGVQLHRASYQSVVGELYKGGRVKVSRKVEELSLINADPLLRKFCG